MKLNPALNIQEKTKANVYNMDNLKPQKIKSVQSLMINAQRKLYIKNVKTTKEQIKMSVNRLVPIRQMPKKLTQLQNVFIQPQMDARNNKKNAQMQNLLQNAVQ